MNKYIVGLVFVIVFGISNAISSTSTIFEDHKLQTYSPIVAGAKDILFEIRVDGLIDNIKRTTAISNIEDLYFRFYWVYPGEYRIEVEGLPKGFAVLKSNLKNQVKPYVDMIFSEDFIRQFERTPFVNDPKEKNSYIKKEDTSSTVSSVRIKLNEKNLLSEIYSKSPYSTVLSQFEYKLRSWSNGKNVLTKIVIEEKGSGIVNMKTIDDEREVFSGIGLPSEIKIEETVSRDSKIITTSNLKLNFSNYNINTGKADRFIRDSK